MSKRCMPFHRPAATAKFIIGLLAGVCALTAVAVSPAEARHRHHFRHYAARHHHIRVAYHIRHMRPGAAETSKFAAIVVDGNSGREIYGRDENALRHPASITKVMTLYLLFEQLQKGRLHLDSRIPISEHASIQAPTKIGLRPGQTIEVDDAIKAIVTQSANDIAVAVAEAIGGDEDHFAEMMTAKAHALGMTRTHYANASGLPNDEQLTTAHDLAILGRAVQERFPQYYRYFSTRGFDYHGVHYHNHNHLLGHVEGVDGIKTGYTRASGFNLMTSVKRDGHFIIAVVLGGASSASRDRLMANLIEEHIDDGVTGSHAPMIAEKAPEEDQAADKASDQADNGKDSGKDPEDEEAADAAPAPHPVAPVKVTPVEAAAKPMPLSGGIALERTQEERAKEERALADSTQPEPPMPIERPRPAFVSAAPKPAPMPAVETEAEVVPVKRPAFDGSTGRSTVATATPSSLRWVVGPAPVRDGEPKRTAKIETRATETVHSVEVARAPEATGAVVDADPDRPAIAHTGWMIQIGATDDMAKASELLARAKAQGPHSLGKAKPFTEKVQKGSETLYRARFAGLEEDTATAACKSLKRSGFACYATKN